MIKNNNYNDYDEDKYDDPSTYRLNESIRTKVIANEC